MTKADLEDIIITLTMIAKRNETNWESKFSDSEVKAIRKIWNHGLAKGDDDYWY